MKGEIYMLNNLAKNQYVKISKNDNSVEYGVVLNVDNNKAWTQGTSSPVLGTFKGTTELKMLNYNIFYEIVNDTYYINNRRQKVMEMIQTCVDDMGVNVIALQEVTAKVWYNHMTSFVNSNSNWAWTGYGRYGATMGTWNGTSNDAFNLILYNTDVYSKVNEGHFWLSDTPDYESYDIYHCYNKRCVNWVELKDKTTGKSFVVVDQHLEETVTDGRANDAGITLTPEDGPTARINQATLICNRMASYVAAGTPVTQMVGVSVFPQRGKNDWKAAGWSSPVAVKLTRGTHTVALRYLDTDVNMNIRKDNALVRELRLRFL